MLGYQQQFVPKVNKNQDNEKIAAKPQFNETFGDNQLQQ